MSTITDGLFLELAVKVFTAGSLLEQAVIPLFTADSNVH